MGKHNDFPLTYFQIACDWPDFKVVTKLQNVLRVYMVLSKGPYLDLCSTQRDQTWTNDPSQCDLSSASVQLLIGWKSPQFLAQPQYGL